MTSDSASRVTRSKRSLQRSLLLAAAVLACVAVLRAQETAPAAPPATQPPAESSAPPQGTGDAAAEAGGDDGAPQRPAAKTAPVSDAAADESDAPAPATTRADGKVGPTRDRFEPTEKVRADFDVSFPVDI